MTDKDLLQEAITNTIQVQSNSSYFDILYDKGRDVALALPALSELIALIASTPRATFELNKHTQHLADCFFSARESGTYFAAVSCEHGLSTHAFWLCQSLHSATLAETNGTLFIPFQIVNESYPLIQLGWYCIYYTNNHAIASGAATPLCIVPLLDRSGIDPERFVDAALEHAASLGLTTDAALSALKKRHPAFNIV